MNILKNNIDQPRTNFHLLPGRLRIGIPGLLNNGTCLSDAIAWPSSQGRVSYANPFQDEF